MSDDVPSKDDIYLFHEGTLIFPYKFFGAHLTLSGDTAGVRFTVWAPFARLISVIGDFNGWGADGQPLELIENSGGIWTVFVPGVQEGALYKYEIVGADGSIKHKADPYAFFAEVRPRSASVVYNLDGHSWQDEAWLERQMREVIYHRPLSIYELHLGSWKKHADGRFFSYRELADELIDYVAEMGYTHIELLPVAEHPYDRSWGYQATGYYAATSRYGAPKDFMYFVDCCHQNNIGVILDWVPGHFCKDDHGLRHFDGTCLYEYADPLRAEHPSWGTLSFDLGKPEVLSFLIGNAIFWMDRFHIDGLRVDAVASMLYLDFDRAEGQWRPNAYGGRENLEAISFLKKLNETVFHYFPQALMIAEESTDWPLVSAPTYAGGLGFNYKWNMGWMNDMLRYIALNPYFRKWHHRLITFSLFYTFSENFILPLSHDEVVYGKRSLLHKMPGDEWQKFANLRVFLSYMMTHPGKKLLFMGTEFAQFNEWNDLTQLDWELLEEEKHRKFQHFVRELNHFYLNEPALWELDHTPDGFSWIDADNVEQSIIIFIREGKRETKQEKKEIEAANSLIVLCNFTPVVYRDFRVGLPQAGCYREVFNSDQTNYGGSGVSNSGPLLSEATSWHERPFSLTLTVPPLAAVLLKLESGNSKGTARIDSGGSKLGSPGEPEFSFHGESECTFSDERRHSTRDSTRF